MTTARLLAEADSWAWCLRTMGRVYTAQLVEGLAAELRARIEADNAVRRIAEPDADTEAA